MKFSPSMIRTWMKCGLQAKFNYIDQIPQQQNAAASLGSAVHLALENYNENGDELAAIELFKDAWDRPAEYGIEPEIWPARTSFGSYREKGIKMLEEYFENYRWSSTATLAQELRFCVPFGKHELSGIVDQLSVDLAAKEIKVIDYKGLALSTEIPTPSGWTTIEKISVGDQVIGSDGLPCNVVGKSSLRHRDCYSLIFDDGTTVIADDEHLWSVDRWDQTLGHYNNVLSTVELLDKVFDPVTGRRNLRIANASPIKLPEADLAIDPYILGLWLGDGTTKAAEITAHPDDVVEYRERLEGQGFRLGKPRIYSSATVPVYTIHGLRSLLVSEGLLRNKHVPDNYLRGSLDQRLDLLRGLMDSDGSYNTQRNQAVFVTTNNKLAHAVHELVVSLGWRANVWTGKSSGPNGFIGTQIKVSFVPFEFNPFHLKRKAELVRMRGTTVSRRRLIKAIEKIDPVPTQCIAVDSADHTFLCTRNMLVTHNSGYRPAIEGLHLDIQFTSYIYAASRKEFWTGVPGSDKYVGLPNGAELYEKYKDFDIIGIWLDLRNSKSYDVGPRGHTDIIRLYRCCDEIERAIEHEVFVPSISGDSCRVCSYKDICPAYVFPEDSGKDLKLDAN